MIPESNRSWSFFISKHTYTYYSPTGLRKNATVTHSTLLVLQEAEKHGVVWSIVPGTQIISLKYKGIEKHFFFQVPSTTTAAARYICKHKKTTSNLLRDAGLQVPNGYRIRKKDPTEYTELVYDALDKPLVVKPMNGMWGDGITTDIESLDECMRAIAHAFEFAQVKKPSVVVQEMFIGDEYRIIATRDELLSVVKRVPANVIGTGKHSIRQLIAQKNLGPLRHPVGNDKSHCKIRIDNRLKRYLLEQDLDLDAVPAKRQQVFLRRISNISQGGDAIDVTDDVHPSVELIATQAVRAIPGLSFAGLDFMTRDISAEQSVDTYVIIEVNDSPGFSINEYPFEGAGRNVSQAFLYLMFPELKLI